jgi:hypothetical protein
MSGNPLKMQVFVCLHAELDGGHESCFPRFTALVSRFPVGLSPLGPVDRLENAAPLYVAVERRVKEGAVHTRLQSWSADPSEPLR